MPKINNINIFILKFAFDLFHFQDVKPYSGAEGVGWTGSLGLVDANHYI